MSSTCIVHVQRMCLHDGPGIRSTVFVKGCPLRCAWCCNPECQKPGPELAFRRDLCMGPARCGLCLRACPQGCLRTSAEGHVHVERAACTACGQCVTVCPAQALAVLGRPIGMEELFAQVERDRPYFDMSQGGVTLSGGEPLTRQDFAATFTEEARRRNLHCLIQTSGYFDMDDAAVRVALRQTHGLCFDIRHTDSTVHRAFTGVDTARILENLHRLGKEFPHLPIIAHTLLIPGFNDSDAVLAEIGRLLAHHPTVSAHGIRPMHSLGQAKYPMLGREVPLSNPQRFSRSRLRHLGNAFCTPPVPSSGESSHVCL